MADEETIISDANVRNAPVFRVTVEDGKTIIRDYMTGEPMYVIDGDIAGGAKPMTTAERTAITPSEGELIYDTDLGAVYVGDGVTTGGVAVAAGGSGGATPVIGSTVSGGTAFVTLENGGGTVALVGVSGTTITEGAGGEIEIAGGGGGGGGGTPATVTDIMTGSGASNILNVQNIRGSLTAGQAVDVTSQPDNVTGDYKGTFSVTGSLGFASFPKYADDLIYLMIADLTATTSGTVTPSGTWLDGTTTAKSLAAGTSTRVAMLFDAANEAKLTFASTGAVSVSNCREYEVTACSAEAVAYIAALSNPDSFASYYLVKQDMVQPWTYIIDMGSSPAVTIASGLSYKLNASTGTHQLTVGTCPAGYDGRDAIIRIRLGGNGAIQAVSPLKLGGALIPYAVNNCVVRFRDGEAVLLVEDTLSGYVVTVTTGTGEGSLPYGLAATGVPYIAFSQSTDGTPIDLSGATTAAEEVTVIGNGYEQTILTGSITCTSKTIMANLALQNVVVEGGTMTLGGVSIPSGSTVAVSGGGIAIEKVTGDGSGSVIDFGGTAYPVISSYALNGASSCTFTGGKRNRGGAFYITTTNGGSATFIGCNFSGNSATDGTGGGALATQNGGVLILSSCSFAENYTGNNVANAVMQNGWGTLEIADCTFAPGQSIVIWGANYTGSRSFVLRGSNKIDTISTVNSSAAATVTIAPGAIIDLEGNTNPTPIAPRGGIVFGANVTVKNSAGQSVLLSSGSAGTCNNINKDGTTN